MRLFGNILLSNRAVLLLFTLPCIVLQQQLLSSPLDVPQHIEIVPEASGKGHIMGHGHSELEVSEWQ